MWIDKAKVRLLAIPTLCALISFAFVVIRPWSKIAGQWAFLVYTSNLIFFFPRGRIGPQIEATVLGVLGGTLGVAWSSATLAIVAYCGRTYGSDSPQSRVVLAIGLASLCMIAGLARSYSRRLNACSKIMLFFPIFQLTSQQNLTHMTSELFLQQFYVVILSAAFALIPTLMLASHHPTNQLGNQINESIRVICDLLPMSISSLLDLDAPLSPKQRGHAHLPEKAIEDQSEPPIITPQSQLARQLKVMVSSLHATSVAFMQDARLLDRQATQLTNAIKALERLQRNPLLGPTSHVPGERIQAALHKTRRPSHISHSRRGSASHTPRRRSRPPRHHESAEETHPRSRPRSSNSPRAALRFDDEIMEEQPDLKTISQQLVAIIVEALWLVDDQLADKYQWEKAQNSGRVTGEGKNLSGTKRDLEIILTQFQLALGGLLGSSNRMDYQDDDDDESHGPNANSDHIARAHATRANLLRSKDRYRLAFYMTALLDLSRDILGIVNTVIHASKRQEEHKVRSWANTFHLSWIWMWRSKQDAEEEDVQEAEKLGTSEQQPYDLTKELQDMDFVSATLHQVRQSQAESNVMGDRIHRIWRYIWDRPDVLKGRVRLSRLAHSIFHSAHVKFSLKMTFGTMMLSLPALFPPGNPGRTWYDTSRGAWMVVSYMFVLEDTTGAILKVGFLRALGTFIGAVMGYICYLIARENPYALVILATACTLPISWNILFTNYPGLGVCIGITLPPVMFIPYLGLAAGQSDFTLAWYRFTDIVIGIAAAVLVGTWIWPVHARVQYFHEVSKTMEEITEFYLRMSRDHLRSSLVYQVDDRQYDRLEAKVKRDFQLARTLVTIQKQEISLLPRPFKLYSEIIDAIERLLEALVEIRMLRFSVPRKATVLDVLPIRRELVSNILISLWACAHAFGSRSPLPQFLPIPQQPLFELMQVTDEHARKLRTHRHAPTPTPTPIPRSETSTRMRMEENEYTAEMAVLYAMAEQEALGEVCNILDELVAAARTLFGTQTFLGT